MERRKNISCAAAILVCIFLVLYGLYCLFLHGKRALLFFFVCLAVFVAIYVVNKAFAYLGEKENLAFPVALISLGFLFMLTFPLALAPDEVYHFSSAYKYSDILLGQTVNDDGFYMRKDDLDFLTGPLSNIFLSWASYTDTVDSFSLMASNTETVWYEAPSSYIWTQNMPQVRFAAVLGIVTARLLGFGAIPLYFLGRLANFAFFVVLVLFAVKITPVGKTVFRVVALLPMTLHLAASYSYDCGILALSFLLSACFLKAIYTEEPLTMPDRIILLVLVAVLSPCKAVYALISCMGILIPSAKFKNLKAALIFKVGLMLCAFGSVAAINGGKIIEIVLGDQTNYAYVDFAGASSTCDLTTLFAEPILTLRLVLNTVFEKTDFYYTSMIAGPLGWLQTNLQPPAYLVVLLSLVLLASTIRSADNTFLMPRDHKIFIVGLFMLLYGSLLFIFFLDWTPLGYATIEGVQGRYFLPMLPLAILALRPEKLSFSVETSQTLLISIAAVDLYYLSYIFNIASAA